MSRGEGDNREMTDGKAVLASRPCRALPKPSGACSEKNKHRLQRHIKGMRVMRGKAEIPIKQ